MATQAVRISPEEYLHMTFDDRPDAELVGGELRERAMPVSLHGWIQMRFGVVLAAFTQLYALAAVRLHLGDGDYRVPDVAVFDHFPPPVPETPPLATIEILSADDRHRAVLRKCEEYLIWGVPHIWLVDPDSKRLQVYSAAGLANVEALELPAYGARIALADLMLGLPEDAVL
ncbi:MAG: Uma2 family endonuclease [Acidobacteria bacterium]|nr:Uma2 family endonuclease [Acidobacteriota bacterium]